MSERSTSLTDGDNVLLQQAAKLIYRGNELKSEPSQLRLVLVEVQVVRFDIGRRYATFKGMARDAFRLKYNENKQSGMSANAAYKEADVDETVTKHKNARDLMEVAYQVLQDFVTTNQTSLGIAKEESKNNL